MGAHASFQSESFQACFVGLPLAGAAGADLPLAQALQRSGAHMCLLQSAGGRRRAAACIWRARPHGSSLRDGALEAVDVGRLHPDVLVESVSLAKSKGLDRCKEA